MLQKSDQHREIKKKLMDLYTELFLHEGYGSLRVQMRFLKRGQKEIVLVCGKEYRYVVDYSVEAAAAKGSSGTSDVEERAVDVAGLSCRKSST
ncbi:type IV pilus biogenesis protein PihO [Syntrophotalea carbinolica DSM 2380]|uniref:Type IV pilus biogenesis protein PihO n=1 Tax=Syntrophotalea carbinolica (strain DSM 2380 / NBRC 103641 / GraBd1) TaxID=338963 RepID=Q3A688_SYNC1|nr:hypothetical protein [Syntrophotalea carbinolica]ABA88119.1 type IV pilus biogenesis protein PihO [Syntrophotalea carbinolica DSM 2380]